MRKSRFTESQIVEILKEGDAGGGKADPSWRIASSGRRGWLPRHLEP
jgi:hypothetical protein